MARPTAMTKLRLNNFLNPASLLCAVLCLMTDTKMMTNMTQLIMYSSTNGRMRPNQKGHSVARQLQRGPINSADLKIFLQHKVLKVAAKAQQV